MSTQSMGTSPWPTFHGWNSQVNNSANSTPNFSATNDLMMRKARQEAGRYGFKTGPMQAKYTAKFYDSYADHMGNVMNQDVANMRYNPNYFGQQDSTPQISPMGSRNNPWKDNSSWIKNNRNYIYS